MPLQRYGTGFLKGLTQVAQQSKADARADEDKKSREATAMMGLALQSGDPELIQSTLDMFGPVLGIPTKAKGGGGARGGAQQQDTPTTVLGRLLIGGLEQGGGAAAGGQGGQGGLRIQTAEEKTQAKITEQQQLDEAKIAQLRRAGVSPEQINLIMQQLAGAPTGPTGFAPQGSVPYTAGVAGEQIPPRPAAPSNLQRMTGNLASDPPGTPASTFFVDPRTQAITAQDGTPVTEAIQQRRAPPAPPSELDRRRIAALDAQAAQEARYEAIPDNYRNLVDAATRRLPAAAQASTQADATDFWEQGDLAGLQRLVRNTVLEEADPITRRQVEGREAAIQALDEIEGLFAELATDSVAADGTVTKGITTGRWVGTVQGGLQWAGRELDPRLTQLTTRINATVIAYRQAVSGAAFTGEEGREYKALFPSIGNTKQLNAALINSTRQSMRSVNQTFWNGRLGSTGAELIGVGRDAPGATQLAARRYLIANSKAVTDESLAAAVEFLRTRPELRPQ